MKTLTIPTLAVGNRDEDASASRLAQRIKTAAQHYEALQRLVADAPSIKEAFADFEATQKSNHDQH